MKHLFAILILSGCSIAHGQDPPPETTTTTTSTTSTTVAPPVTTTAATTTTVPPLDFLPRCPNLIPAARAAGFPEIELEHLDYLAWRESRCDVNQFGQARCSHNAGDPSGGSFGAWQINASWAKKNRYNPHPAGYLGGLGIVNHVLDLCDWGVNARAAKALYDYSLTTHGFERRWWQWKI